MALVLVASVILGVWGYGSLPAFAGRLALGVVLVAVVSRAVDWAIYRFWIWPGRAGRIVAAAEEQARLDPMDYRALPPARKATGKALETLDLRMSRAWPRIKPRVLAGLSGPPHGQGPFAEIACFLTPLADAEAMRALAAYVIGQPQQGVVLTPIETLAKAADDALALDLLIRIVEQAADHAAVKAIEGIVRRWGDEPDQTVAGHLREIAPALAAHLAELDEDSPLARRLGALMDRLEIDRKHAPSS